MRINTNTAAMNTYSQLTSANASKSGSLAKLSSGLRINKAGDDAAGLAISEKMKNQVSGMTQATRNAQDGISLIQTAEGALSETHSILNRMRDLTVQASNDTNTNEDRGAIQKEINSLTSEIGRIAKDTEFNTQSLLTGTVDATTGKNSGTSFNFQIGANAGQSIKLDVNDMSTGGLFVGSEDKTTYEGLAKAAVGKDSNSVEVKAVDNFIASKLTVSNTIDDKGNADATDDVTIAPDFDKVLNTIDSAISKVSEERANLGATQNRLDHTVSNLATTKENLSEANSRITDVDMAEEMMSFTKSNILSQASTAMLAQANQMPQGVLQLLQ